MINLQVSVRTSLIALTVFAASSAHASVITDWNFNSYPVTAPNVNTPAPTTGSGTVTSLGMTNNYTYPSTQSGSGGQQTSATTADDITNDGTSTAPYDVWRIRGATTSGNGWNNSAPEYSQGAQFNVSTAGYNAISLSFTWAATSQGVGNLQVQYTTDGSTWTNVGAQINATVDTVAADYQTDTINFASLGITSVSNDASFGIRLVSAFNPSLAGGTEYASATSVVANSPVQYNDYSGNWRFADVQLDGTATPVPLPASAWLLLAGLGGLAAAAPRRRTC